MRSGLIEMRNAGDDCSILHMDGYLQDRVGIDG